MLYKYGSNWTTEHWKLNIFNKFTDLKSTTSVCSTNLQISNSTSSQIYKSQQIKPKQNKSIIYLEAPPKIKTKTPIPKPKIKRKQIGYRSSIYRKILTKTKKSHTTLKYLLKYYRSGSTRKPSEIAAPFFAVDRPFLVWLSSGEIKLESSINGDHWQVHYHHCILFTL